MSDNEIQRPVSQSSTKARLVYERASRVHNSARVHELTTRREMEAAWLVYVKEMRALGWCVFGDHPESECDCVFIASSRVHV